MSTPLRLTLIAGARPNFMKIAPIIRAIDEFNRESHRISYRLVHTGQHYDKAMSDTFFKELSIPEPHINLEAGSGTQATQTAAIMTRFEEELIAHPADFVIVVGDVNSTLACAVTAKKLHTRVVHVEGGIRSWDQRMPEEINRMVTDSITDHFFTTSELANSNLKREGHGSEKIHFVGNTMIDTLLHLRDRFEQPPFWEELGLKKGGYLLMTLHRPSNVDKAEVLSGILNAIADNNNGVPIVFPVHPRTRKMLDQLGSLSEDFLQVEPQGYLRFNYLAANSAGIITDSGGITEEATVMDIPCITLRANTERPETVEIGTNELVGNDPIKVADAVQRLTSGNWKSGGIPPMWDGKTAPRIIEKLWELGRSLEN